MFYLEPLAGKCQLTQKSDTELDSHAILKSEKAVALERNGRAKCPHRTIQ